MKFVDTSCWAAWALSEDRNHEQARSLFGLIGRNETVLTTNHVIGETWTLLRRRTDHVTAVAFLDRIGTLSEASKLVVHRLTEQQERMSWVWLRRHDERVYSFVDATSFQVMRDRRLREAFAFDHDFSAAGFIELRS